MSKRPARQGPSSPPPPPPITTQEEDEDVEIEDDGDMDELDDEEYDSEAEAQAEALARQMHDQLAAEIGKVYGLRADGTPDPIIPLIRHLFDFATSDSRVHSLLATTPVPAVSVNVFDLLSEYLDMGDLAIDSKFSLSEALLKLLDGPGLDEIEAPASITGKRKRESMEHSPLPPPSSSLHPIAPSVPYSPISTDMEARIREASNKVLGELERAKSAQAHQLSLALKPQLGQIYQFASTFADAVDPSSSVVLREISKLIRDTDILDKQQLAYPPSAPSDTSTAVFPCYRHPCTKLFASSSNLTKHTSTAHSGNSNASLAAKAKVTLQYQCDACKALFSGRDGLRSHQATAASPACLDASSNIIELRDPGAAAISREDGELDPIALERAQFEIVKLHLPLKDRADRARAANGGGGRGSSTGPLSGSRLMELTTLDLDDDVSPFPEFPTPVKVEPVAEHQVKVEGDVPDGGGNGDGNGWNDDSMGGVGGEEEAEAAEDPGPQMDDEEQRKLEEAMLKMVEDAQAEAEAEMMLDMEGGDGADMDVGESSDIDIES